MRNEPQNAANQMGNKLLCRIHMLENRSDDVTASPAMNLPAHHCPVVALAATRTERTLG